MSCAGFAFAGLETGQTLTMSVRLIGDTRQRVRRLSTTVTPDVLPIAGEAIVL